MCWSWYLSAVHLLLRRIRCPTGELQLRNPRGVIMQISYSLSNYRAFCNQVVLVLMHFFYLENSTGKNKKNKKNSHAMFRIEFCFHSILKLHAYWKDTELIKVVGGLCSHIKLITIRWYNFPFNTSFITIILVKFLIFTIFCYCLYLPHPILLKYCYCSIYDMYYLYESCEFFNQYFT